MLYVGNFLNIRIQFFILVISEGRKLFWGKKLFLIKIDLTYMHSTWNLYFLEVLFFHYFHFRLQKEKKNHYFL